MSSRDVTATDAKIEAAFGLPSRGRLSAWRRPRRFVPFAVLALALAGASAWFAVARLSGGSGTPASPLTVQQIMPPLTRSGTAPGGVEVDVTYAPPLFFRVTGQQPPAGAAAKAALVFFLQENVHEGFLPAAAAAAFLQVDGGARMAPYARAMVSNDPHHRVTRLQFAATAVDGQTLTLLFPARSGVVPREGRLTWRLPVAIRRAGEAAAGSEQAAAREAETGTLGLSALTRTLRKTVGGVRMGGVSGVEVEAVYATPKYFEDALPPSAAARYAPKSNFVFVFSESSHAQELPLSLPRLALSVGGQTVRPDLVDRKIVSPHHQVAFVRFPGDPKLAERPGIMRLELPDGSALRWALPLSFTSHAGAMSPFGIPWASILALLGGFLGAMWPCLFQLTVFFMPTLAGVGAQQAASGDSRAARRQIAKAAFFFVLGFTIVYTSAGALIGFAAQRLQDTSAFLTYQHYVGIGAGVVILVLAVRVAVRGRAPLVCKMPIAPRMKRRSGATPVEMMLAGLAFATGCMTCFGTALVVGMVVYVGLSNSALYGAFILFVFSLGMAIPLGIAAMAMGRVMPLFSRMERAMPWMALTSSLIMVGFAALLISGNYMALSSWFYGLTR